MQLIDKYQNDPNTRKKIQKKSKIKKCILLCSSILFIGGISVAGYVYFNNKNPVKSVSSEEKEAFLQHIAKTMTSKYGSEFSGDSDEHEDAATVSVIPGTSDTEKTITVKPSEEVLETTTAETEIAETTETVSFQKCINNLNQKNFLAYRNTETGYIYYASLENAVFSLQGAPDKAWEVDLYATNKPESKVYHFHSTNKSTGAGRETLSSINALERLFPFLYNASQVEEDSDGWDLVYDGMIYHINGKEQIRFISNESTGDVLYFTSLNALATTYPDISNYFKTNSDAFISLMTQKINASVGKDNAEGQTACQFAERAFTNALLKLSERQTLDDIAKDKLKVQAENSSFIKALDMTVDDFQNVLNDLLRFNITDYNIVGYEKNPDKDAMDIHYFRIKSQDTIYTVFFSETRHTITNVTEFSS